MSVQESQFADKVKEQKVIEKKKTPTKSVTVQIPIGDLGGGQEVGVVASRANE